MEILTYSETRARLKEVMDRAVDDHVPVVITRRGGRHVVLMSFDDWRSRNETDYLLSTPANAAELRESIRQLNAGEGKERELIEP